MGQGADDARTTAASPGWSQPLRLHLSVIIVVLLLAISLPLMWLTYAQGTRSAVQAAEQQMLLLSRHAVDRYRSIFGDGLSAISLTSVSVCIRAANRQPSSTPRPSFCSRRWRDRAMSTASMWATRRALSCTRSASRPTRLARGDLGAGRGGLRRAHDRRRPGRCCSRHGASSTATADRSARITDDANYDPRQRPWYRTAALNPDPIAVGPYVMATTGKLGLTLARTMKGHGDTVVGGDVLLETISKLLSSEGVSEHARGYVFDDTGRLIVHSDEAMMKRVLEELNGKERADQLADEDPALAPVKALLGGADVPPERAATFTVDGETYLAHIATTGCGRLAQQQHRRRHRPARRFHRSQRRPAQEGPGHCRYPAGDRHRSVAAHRPPDQPFAVVADGKRPADRRSRTAGPGQGPFPCRRDQHPGWRARRRPPGDRHLRALRAARAGPQDRRLGAGRGRQRRAPGGDGSVHRHPRLHDDFREAVRRKRWWRC